MKYFFQQTTEEVLLKLGTTKEGLTDEQVTKQRDVYGLNQLEEKKSKNVFQVFFMQFFDLLVMILIAAAIISLTTGNFESTIVILVVIMLNAVLGTVQHFKAEKSLESLKALSSPLARVIRNDYRVEIDAKEIVIGDIIALEAGDMIPADARLIENYSLQVNESALTGESESVHKNCDAIAKEELALGDQINMVFSGSMVTYGRALAVVTGTGMNTEIGRIAKLMNDTKERKTPLQVSLNRFSKKLSLIIIAICFIVFGLTLYHELPGNEWFTAVMDSLMFAVALAVAAIPEALSSIVTISLAIGTSRMAKQNAIIKNLRAVEGLGCVSIICSDKTGTLTQNKMTVTDYFYYGEGSKKRLFLTSILCNDTTVTDGKALGDPTETCLTEYYRKYYSDYDNRLEEYPRLAEIPFDSDRKLMSTLHCIDDTLYILTKGAVDVLLERVTHILGGSYDYGPRYLDSPLCQWAGPDRRASETPWLASNVFCAANPAKYSDPSGDKISAFATDSSSQYFWDCKNDIWGFYNSSNELYDGFDEFILELTKALSFIMGGNTGASLISYLVGVDEILTINNYRSDSGSVTSPNGLAIGWDYRGVNLPTQIGMVANPHIELAHEMGHSYLKLTKQEPDGVWFTYDNRQILLREIAVTHIENMIRAENNLPLRTHYMAGVAFSRIIHPSTNCSLYYSANGEISFFPYYGIKPINYKYR